MVDGVSGHAVAIESVISGTAGCIAIAGAGADTSATAAAGEGGLITFADSNWLASIVLPHQPHFLGQPRNIDVFWGYGLLSIVQGTSSRNRCRNARGERL